MHDNLISLLWLAAFCAPLYYFIFRGRNRGFTALARRTLQLRQSGTGAVYYLYSNSFVGDNSSSIGRGGGLGALLNTGYIAYEQAGTLVIEYPWWNVMRIFRRYKPGTVELSLRNEYQAGHPKPGVYIDDRTYVVAGINITEARQLKRLWRLADTALLESNRQMMVAHLMQLGFIFSNN